MDLDEFSDDGLDDLPDNALQELEQNALQFTQAQAHAQRGQPSQDGQQYSDYGWEEEEDDLDTTEVTNDAGAPVGRPAVDKARQQQHQQQLQQEAPRRPVPPVPNPRWNPVINPAERPATALASRPHLPSVATPRFPSQTPAALTRPQPSQFARPPVAQTHYAPSQASQGPRASQGPAGDVLSALQQRVRALESELNAARGESSIIRSNATKAQQRHDAELARLKMLSAEQMVKQERAAEAAIAAEKTASTELQFLQRDMREASGRARRREISSGSGTSATMTTPKKANKTRGFADGFDEMDIAASPSKGQRNRNAGPVASNVGERTPSKGKRKRPVVDSPIMALETHTDDVFMGEDKPASVAASAAQPPAVVTAPPALPFEFLQLVLDHGCFRQQPPTFDVLSRFAFPSEPNVSLASIVFQRLPLMGDPRRPMQLLVDFAEFVVTLWRRCFDEPLWEPIKYLVALISFTFQLHTASVAPLVINTLAPIAQSTIYAVAELRHRLPDDDLAKNDEYCFMDEHLDTASVLALLQTLALSCATTTTVQENGAFEYQSVDFWRLISLDTVLLLLTPKQKLGDVVGMLNLLASSSLPGSVGPITEEKDPDFVARIIIERVSAKLTEFPRSATTPEQRRSVRTAALQTLITFARYPFGALQLAAHDNCLPRLVACLGTSIDDLYDQPIPSHILPPLRDPSTALPFGRSTSSADLHRIISQCVLLIHTLATDPRTANVADVAQKLSMSFGGSQRYLLALGRLTFAEEDLVMEAGIEGEVVEMAQELLEIAVTPDEGEIVSQAFGA